MRYCILVLGLVAGCNNPVYLSQNRALETRTDPMGQGFQADTDLWVLPVRQPTDVERMALDEEQAAKMLPMAVPWVASRDFAIEIVWTVKNLEATPTQAFVTLVGGNEFGDYQPMMFIDPTLPLDDQTPPPPLQGGSPINLAANEIKNGVFREDQITESSIDLEAITRYPDTDVMATPFMVIEHLSTTSRIGLDGVPAEDVTPMMARFFLTLSADGHVALDYVVRVRDKHGKLAAPTDSDLYIDTAAALAPPVNPMGMMP